MKITSSWMILAAGAVAAMNLQADEAAWKTAEQQFRDLPPEARRLTGPLFWLHGDESRERLETELDKVAEGGNGCFTAESRPHSDWLGPGWFRDLDICLQKAKQLNLEMWIFDEKWWPSQGVAGRVPARYAAKRLAAASTNVVGPRAYEAVAGGERYVAAVAGRLAADNKIDGGTLTDLAPHVRDGRLRWQVPDGQWKVMTFTHTQAPGLGQGGGSQLSVDGASKDCVDWFLETVYQPHYDRFKADFGKTIRGYFYDEPETRGDWGTGVNPVLAEWGVDWKQAYVAYKFELAGEAQTAARYQYLDAFAEAWGRTMYGGMTEWCHRHGVKSFGHFMEHGNLYLHPEFCAGDVMRLLRYSDMGALDAVFRQFVMGRREAGDAPIWQTPKLGSSVSHVFGKPDDVAMVEIFGARGQDLSYAEMKWWADHMQASGVNFLIPHSFNPRAPYDSDCPPYFYNGGYEPRFPLYRVFADYTSRLSLMLTGGRHVCPAALLFGGNARRVGRMTPPEDLSTALQDALFDCDWLPFDTFERDAKLDGKDVALHQERYRVLIVPPVEVIPFGALAKARDFFAQGGVVAGYGFLPTKSATLGKTSAEVAALCRELWGDAPQAGMAACRTSPAGGRSYFLPEKPEPAQLAQALGRDAGVAPVVEVLAGDTSGWVHGLHRQKDGRDVFLICNQNHEGAARRFTFRLRAAGEPELWDAMRNEITSVTHRRVDAGTVDLDLTLEPLESALVVFRDQKRDLPPRLEAGAKPAFGPVAIVRDAAATFDIPAAPRPGERPKLDGCAWVWYPEGNPAQGAPPGTRWFRKTVTLPDNARVESAEFLITCDNRYTLFVNGQAAGKNDGGESWRSPRQEDIAKLLRPGANLFAVEAVNESDKDNPAGLVGRYTIALAGAAPVTGSIGASWKAANRKADGWEKPGFDDAPWVAAKEVAKFGGAPWGALDGRGAMALSPCTPDPFLGRCTLANLPDPKAARLFLEMDDLPAPELAARVKVNGQYAGGVIGRPFRLDVTARLKPGENTIEIVPLAPKAARIVGY